MKPGRPGWRNVLAGNDVEAGLTDTHSGFGPGRATPSGLPAALLLRLVPLPGGDSEALQGPHLVAQGAVLRPEGLHLLPQPAVSVGPARLPPLELLLQGAELLLQGLGHSQEIALLLPSAGRGYYSMRRSMRQYDHCP